MIVPVYLLFATFLPLTVMMYFYLNNEGNANWYWGVNCSMYFLNPFYTFFLGNFSIIINTLPKRGYIEFLPEKEATPKATLVVMFCQTIFYFFLTIFIDQCRSNRFRKADKQQPKIEQPQLPVNDDVREHENQINQD